MCDDHNMLHQDLCFTPPAYTIPPRGKLACKKSKLISHTQLIKVSCRWALMAWCHPCHLLLNIYWIPASQGLNVSYKNRISDTNRIFTIFFFQDLHRYLRIKRINWQNLIGILQDTPKFKNLEQITWNVSS